jgi:predicted RNA-binding protein YlxR (DUF448 family)
MGKKPVLRFDCVNHVKVEKSTLLRVVLTPDGHVEVDPSGRMNGRGVYLTPDRETLEKAKKTKALEKSLGTGVPEEVYNKIERYLVK